MKSMASEFARRGNPMITDREQIFMQARLLPARGGARKAKPKPKWVDPPVEKSERPVNLAQETLKQVLRMMDLPARRCVEPESPPRPLVFQPRPDLEAIAENEARRAEYARMKLAQERADEQARIARIYRGFELTMTFALSDEITE